MHGMRKHYGGAQALAGVEFAVERGEIHALLGGNGAGKSTVIKILAGVERADEGSITIDGRTLPRHHAPQAAAAAGLRFVHQDLGLVDELSIAENVALETGFARRFGLIDFGRTAVRVKERLASVASDLDPARRVGELSQAEKVIVAIARVLDEAASVIVLDEVTASLPSPEAARLHEVLKAARGRGMSFVFVTHRIEEIFGLCDRATVMANGRRVATADVASIDHQMLVRWIIGRDMGASTRREAKARGPLRLRLEGALGAGILEPVSLDVAEGEILGITGLIGSGYLELAHWLAGLETPASGRLDLGGVGMPFGDPRRLRQAKCEVVVGDRARGAFADLTVRENMFPTRLSLSVERRRAAELVERYGVRPGDCSEAAIRTLSGGNQQKVLFLRAIEQQPQVIVLIDPTVGVDVGAREELYAILHAEAARGASVILASSDFDEVAAHSHRVLVLSGGTVAAMLAGGDLTRERLIAEAHRPVRRRHAQGAAA
jgi:ribose transport system ATP-binding protein